jgi:hypothetical protein
LPPGESGTAASSFAAGSEGWCTSPNSSGRRAMLGPGISPRPRIRVLISLLFGDHHRAIRSRRSSMVRSPMVR